MCRKKKKPSKRKRPNAKSHPVHETVDLLEVPSTHSVEPVEPQMKVGHDFALSVVSLYLLLPGFFFSVNNHGECFLTQHGITVVAVVSQDRLWSEKRLSLTDSPSLYFGNLANAICLPNNGCKYLLSSGWRCVNYSAIDLLSVCLPDNRCNYLPNNGCNYLLLSGWRCVNYRAIDLPSARLPDDRCNYLLEYDVLTTVRLICLMCVRLMCESMSTNADRGSEDTGGHAPTTRIRARHFVPR